MIKNKDYSGVLLKITRTIIDFLILHKNECDNNNKKLTEMTIMIENTNDFGDTTRLDLVSETPNNLVDLNLNKNLIPIVLSNNQQIELEKQNMSSKIIA